MQKICIVGRAGTINLVVSVNSNSNSILVYPLVLWSHTHAIGVTEHQDAISLFVGNELARTHHFPQRLPHVLAIIAVVLAHHLSDGRSGLSRVVEWNSRHIVVQNVGLDDVVENVLANETVITVDGSSSTSGKRPFFGCVMRHRRVCVLQESHKHQPVVDPQPWNKPVDHHVEQAKVLVPLVNGENGGQDSNVRQDNVPVLVSIENRRRWSVVTLGVPWKIDGLARGICGQVRPTAGRQEP